MKKLTGEELKRYARQIILPGIGEAGQERLKASSVLVVGAGGLGSPAAFYLAAAGVGRIGIADSDRVDVGNLQRQILHGTSDVGGMKTESAALSLARLNPTVKIVQYPERILPPGALDLARDYDVVVDCCDNFATRYLVNDACMLLGKPYVYGSVFQFEGQASVFLRGKSPCYRCLFPEPPPREVAAGSAEAGIVGTVPGVIGSIQANEALKLLLGIGKTLAGRLLLFNALDSEFRLMNVSRDPGCPLCGKNPKMKKLLDDYDAFCNRE